MKKIGVEVTRLFVLEVEDDVDTSDWLGMGMLVSEMRDAVPEAIDLVAWNLGADGDVYSDASVANEELARKKRFDDAMDLFDAQMQKRTQFLL